MFDWLRELLDIRYENKKRNTELKLNTKETSLRIEPEYDDTPVCESCITLKEQLSLANARERRLLDQLLKEPETEKPQEYKGPVIIPPSGARRWSIQRAELEANDRREKQLRDNKARELAATPSAEEVAEFEKELDSVVPKTGESSR